MSRDLSKLHQLKTAAALVEFMSQDRDDRILRESSDLGFGEPDSAFAARGDAYILVVCSMRAVGATSVDEYVNLVTRQGFVSSTHPDEIGVVSGMVEGEFGRAAPDDIQRLLIDAEGGVQGCPIALAVFDGMYLLAGHPEALPLPL